MAGTFRIYVQLSIRKLKGPLNFFVIGEFRYSQLLFNVQCHYENCFLNTAANIRIVVETGVLFVTMKDTEVE